MSIPLVDTHGSQRVKDFESRKGYGESRTKFRKFHGGPRDKSDAASVTLRTAVDDDYPSQPVVYRYVERFKENRESFVDDPRPGRPSTARNVETVGRVGEKNSR